MFPMLKSFAGELASTYKDWYAFVESHTEGRFSSQTASISDKHNSIEEAIHCVWESNLVTSGKGVYKNINDQRGSLWDEVEISVNGFKKAVKNKAVFMNINDRFSKKGDIYQKQVGWYWDAMQKLFSAKIEFAEKK